MFFSSLSTICQYQSWIGVVRGENLTLEDLEPEPLAGQAS
jgi:hypothetical protein